MQHIEFLRTQINDLHNEIVLDTINGIDASNKAILIKKYKLVCCLYNIN